MRYIIRTVIGSGTTAIEAKNSNRHYIGYEINKEFYKVAKNRLGEPENDIIKSTEENINSKNNITIELW